MPGAQWDVGVELLERLGQQRDVVRVLPEVGQNVLDGHEQQGRYLHGHMSVPTLWICVARPGDRPKLLDLVQAELVVVGIVRFEEAGHLFDHFELRSVVDQNLRRHAILSASACASAPSPHRRGSPCRRNRRAGTCPYRASWCGPGRPHSRTPRSPSASLTPQRARSGRAAPRSSRR